MTSRSYQPAHRAEFWCNVCDRNVVDSEKPETGDFFLQYGHAFNSDSRAYDGEYIGVMFAICNECRHE